MKSCPSCKGKPCYHVKAMVKKDGKGGPGKVIASTIGNIGKGAKAVMDSILSKLHKKRAPVDNTAGKNIAMYNDMLGKLDRGEY